MKITVIFLLYNAERAVERLVERAHEQVRPGMAQSSDWIEILFMDDRSRDGTWTKLQSALSSLGNPSNYRAIRNDPNLGLAATLNKAFGEVRTPFVLTCHCDCFFATDDYVSRMLDLLLSRPDAAAVTGQQAFDRSRGASFIEKLNLVANLMDILPAPSSAPELVPVGFAEGRCDGFRMEALRKVGFYDTSLRTAGEDQIIAARMRENGYQVYRATRLRYWISVSDEQDTFTKQMRHQRLFGRVHPYLLFRKRGVMKGIQGGDAGSNRQARSMLRAQQLLAVASYFCFIAGFAARLPLGIAGMPLAAVLLWKFTLFARQSALVGFTVGEMLRFWALQPLLDLSYGWGFLEGLVIALRGPTAKPIQ